MGASKAQNNKQKQHTRNKLYDAIGEGLKTSPSTEALLAAENNNNTILSGLNGAEDNLAERNIGEFYRDAKILITGATGFVGKALLEKLLRTCALIDTVYLLMRPLRGLGVEQRLKELLKNPVFDKIREKTPEVFDKIRVVEGDVAQPNLGLSQKDLEHLTEGVNIVFHSAASVRFNEGLKEAVVLNTLGTKRVTELCLRMRQLKSFVHVSTAYSNADKREVDEMVYTPPHDPLAIINCVENLPEDALSLLAEKLVGKHPNTYTLSKAMAEHIIFEHSGELPAAIVRPSIVAASWKEPFPGWVDNVSGITGIMMEIGRGTIKSIVCDENLIMDLIPVDIVANTLVTAAWHTATCRSNTMRVYNCISGQINGVSWKEFGQHTKRYALEYPSKYVTWYPGFTYRTNRVMHWVCSLFFHTLPACVLDVILYCTKHKPIMLRICRKFAKAARAGEFFALNEWDFRTATMTELVDAVAKTEDGGDYSVSVGTGSGFEWDSFVKTYMLGIRQYVLKDDAATLPAAKTKLNRLYWLNKAIQAMATYIFLRLAIK